MSYPPPPPPPGYWRAPPPALAPNGQPLAIFGDRFLAYLLDSLILGAVGAMVSLPLMFGYMFLILDEMVTAQQNGDTTLDPVLFFGAYFAVFGVIIVFMIVAAYLYFVEYQLRKGGQTVGKKVMKIWVVPVSPAETLTRTHLVKRWLVQSVASQFVPMLGLLDGLWQLWDKPWQQCLHDKVAQTVVVKLG